MVEDGYAFIHSTTLKTHHFSKLSADKIEQSYQLSIYGWLVVETVK